MSDPEPPEVIRHTKIAGVEIVTVKTADPHSPYATYTVTNDSRSHSTHHASRAEALGHHERLVAARARQVAR